MHKDKFIRIEICLFFPQVSCTKFDEVAQTYNNIKSLTFAVFSHKSSCTRADVVFNVFRAHPTVSARIRLTLTFN